MRKTVLFISLVLILALGFLTFQLVPAASSSNCMTVSGVLTNVSTPCCADIVFKLKNDHSTYYLNRGLELGLSISALKEELLNKEVSLRCIKRKWSPLDPGHKMKPLADILLDGKTILNNSRLSEK